MLFLLHEQYTGLRRIMGAMTQKTNNLITSRAQQEAGGYWISGVQWFLFRYVRCFHLDQGCWQ